VSVEKIERYESDILIDKLDYDERVRACCTGCEMYGKNLACPPHSPDLREFAANARSAKIICYRAAIAHFKAATIEESYYAAFATARDLLVEELLKYRSEGKAVAGCGPCTTCRHCALENGDVSCTHPSKRIYSLESLGINLIALSEKAFNIKLEWSDGESATAYVSAIGAVFE
jgi:predicted metal-binding protein